MLLRPVAAEDAALPVLERPRARAPDLEVGNM